MGGHQGCYFFLLFAFPDGRRHAVIGGRIFVSNGLFGLGFGLLGASFLAFLHGADVKSEHTDKFASFAALSVLLFDLRQVFFLGEQHQFLKLEATRVLLDFLLGPAFGVEEVKIEGYLLGVGNFAVVLAAVVFLGHLGEGGGPVPEVRFGGIGVLGGVMVLELLVGEVEVDFGVLFRANLLPLLPLLALFAYLVDNGGAE